MWSLIFFFNDTATTEIYTLSLHDALPIFYDLRFTIDEIGMSGKVILDRQELRRVREELRAAGRRLVFTNGDRKSTRLNSSHANISYAGFCLKKNNPLLAITVVYNSHSHDR